MDSISDPERDERPETPDSSDPPVVPDMVTDWVDIAGCPTYSTRFGSVRAESRFLILLVPGAAGIPGHYEDFMRCLHELSSRTLPVWCVSYAGYTKVSKQQARSQKVGTVCGETDHLLQFIETEVPPTVRLILVGHSIGCYMILSIMRSLPRDRIFKALLLFPTIERMVESPNGRLASPLLKYFRWVVPLALHTSFWIPRRVKSWIIRLVLAVLYPVQPNQILSSSSRGNVNSSCCDIGASSSCRKQCYSSAIKNSLHSSSNTASISSSKSSLETKASSRFSLSVLRHSLNVYSDDCASVKASVELSQPHLMCNMMDIAHQGIREVREADLETISENLDKILLYYGSIDRWAPRQSYYEPMRSYCEREIESSERSNISQLNIDNVVTCDELNTEHVFLLQSSDVIARIVYKWISKYVTETVDDS